MVVALPLKPLDIFAVVSRKKLMNKKEIIDLKKSQIIILDDSDNCADIEKGVSYYPLSSVAMIMERGADSEKFRTDGILWGLWGDSDLKEKDFIDMKCCFDYGTASEQSKKSNKKTFSVLFFDGSVREISFNREEFEFLIGNIRRQILEIKDKTSNLSPLSGSLPMVRSMDNDEINMVIDWRKKAIRKKHFAILFFDIVFSFFAILGVYSLDESLISLEGKCFSVFIIVSFLSIVILSLSDKKSLLRDVEAEVSNSIV